MQKTFGIHHVTAITSDPQKNLDFYEGFLGQRLVKKTVNFDDPTAYHLYYGDAVGTPGTIITFFYWAHIPAGKRGYGEVASIFYTIPEASLSYWKERSLKHNVTATERVLPFGETCLTIYDPDGLEIGLVATDIDNNVIHWEEGPVPKEHALRGFYGALLALPEYIPIAPVLVEGLGYEHVETKQTISRYQAVNWPGKFIATEERFDQERAIQGAGSIHHIAFSATDDPMRDTLRKQVTELGLQATGMIDRQYFHSTYFMTPAGILFEIATNNIGFTVDEPVSELGEHLMLPPQYEIDRKSIESTLAPLHHHENT